jgi:hypothetical protein
VSSECFEQLELFPSLNDATVPSLTLFAATPGKYTDEFPFGDGRCGAVQRAYVVLLNQ